MARKQIIWDDFSGGMSQNPFFGAKGQYANSEGINIDVNLTNIPDERGNYIYFGTNFSEIGASTVDQTSAITGFVHDPKTGSSAGTSVNYAYNDSVGELYKIVGITRSGATISKVNDTTTAETKGLAYYNDGIFYSTGADIGRYGDLSGTPTADDDWMSTVATSGAVQNDSTADHPMHVHKDNKLYIGDGRYVNALETTTYTNQALDIPIDYSVVAMDSFGNDLLIAANLAKSGFARKGPAKVFFWNTFDDSFYRVEDVHIEEIRTIKYINGNLLVFSSRGEILVWDNQSFRVIHRLSDREAPIAGQHGIDNYLGGLLVAGSTKIFYLDLDSGIKVHSYYSTPAISSTQGAISVVTDAVATDNINIYCGTDTGLFELNSTATADAGAFIQSLYFTTDKTIKIESAQIYMVGGVTSGPDSLLQIIDLGGTATTIGTLTNANHANKRRINFDGMTDGSGTMPEVIGGFAIKYKANSAFATGNVGAIKSIVVNFETAERYD